jgi:hypothetical protein
MNTSAALVGRAPPYINYINSGNHGRFGHVMTRISAALAGISAEAHLLILGEALAGGFALLAHLGADSAGVWMKLRSAEHEVGAGLADLSAIEQQADMRCFAHLPAAGEAMADGQGADAMAVAAVLDAMLDVVRRRFIKTHWTSLAS